MALAKSSGVFGVKNLKIFKMLTDAEGAYRLGKQLVLAFLGLNPLKCLRKLKRSNPEGMNV